MSNITDHPIGDKLDRFWNGLSTEGLVKFPEYLRTLYPGSNLSDFDVEELELHYQQMKIIALCGSDPIEVARREAAGKDTTHFRHQKR